MLSFTLLNLNNFRFNDIKLNIQNIKYSIIEYSITYHTYTPCNEIHSNIVYR